MGSARAWNLRRRDRRCFPGRIAVTGSHNRKQLDAIAGAVAASSPVTAWVLFRSHIGTDKVMLAVLPFQNLSDDQQEYFADGMTEEMITQLGGLNPQR